MLRLNNIKKDYYVADMTVHALKGVSVSFRKSEFVSILGPSGCGKTTLLNIIGGLDKYTDGDLFIAGRSTKEFTDRDWDVYRNHRIGFIFQSYNLIPHQTILGNVELALTIAGISKEERKERAKKALDRVGLAGQYRKKPNQLSGGQCQRVAIARALVNEPEILLADEPTGALDTETSVQIMELIKEIANEKLVIMVTHNPELAEKYSTRIVRCLDGLILSDSNPFDEKDEIKEIEEINKAKEAELEATCAGLTGKELYEAQKKAKAKEKAKMSFKTSFALSAKNLLSKFKRTLLVGIAGSIGIIGVSAVLSVSTGVHDYIDSMQDDLLSGNPITISKTAIDYSALMGGSSFKVKKQAFEKGNWVNVQSIIGYLVENETALETLVSNNEITKDYIDYILSMPTDSYNAISLNYGVDMTASIYTDFVCGPTTSTMKSEYNKNISLNAINQTYASAITKLDYALPEEERVYGKYADAITSLTSPIGQYVDNNDYILSQYDVIDGHLPTNETECLLVLSKDRTLTDLVLAQLGLYSQDDFYNLVYERKVEDAAPGEYYFRDKINFEDIYKQKYTWYDNNTIYKYNESVVTALQTNIDTAQLNLIMACKGSTDDTVKVPATVIFEGMMMPGSHTEDEINQATAELMLAVTKSNDPTVKDALATVTAATTALFTSDAIFSYNYEAQSTWAGTDLKIVGILSPKENISYGSLSQGLLVSEKLARNAVKVNKESEIVKYTKANRTVEYQGQTVSTGMGVKYNLPYYWETKLGTETILNGTDVNSVYVGQANAMSAIMKAYGLSSSTSTSTTMSLSALAGSTDPHGEIIPESISIYPLSFEMKDKVTDYLDKWNDIKTVDNEGVDVTFNRLDDDGNVTQQITLYADERTEIKYTDSVELIINMINTMINIVTYALVAFTALSLLVSSVMIAIITYVSVMERIKEIGVIRALGGRKKDVSHLFNAETFIIGLASGLIGIAFTYLLQILINVIVRVASKGSVTTIAHLKISTALIMIAVSIILTVISGLIPSRSAAKKDPVVALRTE